MLERIDFPLEKESSSREGKGREKPEYPGLTTLGWFCPPLKVRSFVFLSRFVFWPFCPQAPRGPQGYGAKSFDFWQIGMNSLKIEEWLASQFTICLRKSRDAAVPPSCASATGF